MDKYANRRSEKRLRYCWPVWFGSDFSGQLSQGQMVDVNSRAAAFSCYSHQCPGKDQHITARFSVPIYGRDGSFDMGNYIRSGWVSRVDRVNAFLQRAVLQFEEALDFQPGEQPSGQLDWQAAEEAVGVEV